MSRSKSVRRIIVSDHSTHMRNVIQDNIQNSDETFEVVDVHDLEFGEYSNFFESFGDRDLFVLRPYLRPPHQTNEFALRRFFHKQEWNNLIMAMAHQFDAKKFYNHPMRVMLSSGKPAQLSAAKKCGFTVPETIIANKLSRRVESLFNNFEKIIIKPIDTTVAPNPTDPKDSLILYTQPIKIDEFKEILGEMRGSPVIIQENINKNYEARVVVFGDRAFGIKINSQNNIESKYDCRRRIGDRNMFTYHEIDADTAKKCSKYLEFFGLDSGVFDFAVKSSGQYVFFECNANGQWVGDDWAMGGNIAKGFAYHLAEVAQRIST